MKRFLLVMVLVLIGAATIDVVGDATQTRPDKVPKNSRSEIVLAVRTGGRYPHTPSEAAGHLWGACSSNTSRKISAPGMVEIEPGRFQFAVEPGLGTHQRRRLVGCLEDLTIDYVIGNVLSVELIVDDD